LFQVAASPVTDKEKRESYNAQSVPAPIKVKPFFFPGRMIMRNLSRFDRFMLKMGARLAKKPADKVRMLTDFDEVKKENILPLIYAVKTFASKYEPKKELV